MRIPLIFAKSILFSVTIWMAAKFWDMTNKKSVGLATHSSDLYNYSSFLCLLLFTLVILYFSTSHNEEYLAEEEFINKEFERHAVRVSAIVKSILFVGFYKLVQFYLLRVYFSDTYGNETFYSQLFAVNNFIWVVPLFLSFYIWTSVQEIKNDIENKT